MFEMFQKATVDYKEYFLKNDLVLSNIQPYSFDTYILTNNRFNKILKEIANDPLNFQDYYIQEGMRVDQVSGELYRSYDYWWTLLYFNKFDNAFMWPLSNEDLQKLAEYVFETDGNYASVEICFNLLYEQNELARNIKVIVPAKIEPLMIKLELEL